MTPLDELTLLLRPAGGGVFVVSTGRAEQLAMQKALYRATTEDEVIARWRDALARVGEARGVILGVPSDVGAGFRRGANLGPQTIRAALLEEVPDFPERAARAGLVDLGDVLVVPQLLHDDMLSDAQRTASRRAMHPDALDAALPVSPLSVAERALDLVFAASPGVKPIVLGGDHSTAWPAVAALAKVARAPWGIVQIDAHTDLLESRLGVRYCFATWSFHANELIGRSGRLVQVGIRATRHDRGHWESTLGVRQFWADECVADPERALDAIVAHVKATGVSAIYFSNDIDGTDEAWAEATGTPEPNGLSREFVEELIARLAREVTFLGGDVMEVAPPLGRDPAARARTIATAVRYLRATLRATLGVDV